MVKRKSPFSRNLRRQIDRLNQDGEHCHGCRRPYEDRDRSLIGYDGSGKLLMVGACCSDRLVKVVAGSIYFTSHSGLDPLINELHRHHPKQRGGELHFRGAWMAEDKDWFAAHPERSHRLRRAHPEEWPDDCPFTVVRQVAPGQRMRLGVIVSELLPQEGEAPEAAAWAIWDLILEARDRGAREVTAAAVVERWRQLEETGRA